MQSNAIWHTEAGNMLNVTFNAEKHHQRFHIQENTMRHQIDRVKRKERKHGK